MAKPIYEKRSLPGKGIGLVATQYIPNGTRILSESPLITGFDGVPIKVLGNCITEQFNNLDKHQQQEFLSLHNIRLYSNTLQQYCGIYSTNAIPLHEPSSADELLHHSYKGGVFLNACRINHSCRENAVVNWNDNIKRLTVTASKDISKDEEITIYYIELRNHRKARRAILLKDFKFECECSLCSLPPKQRKDSDRQLNEIIKLMSLAQGRHAETKWSNPQRTLHEFDQAIRLFNEQGIGDIAKVRLFIQAAQLSISYCDLARGKIFAERARSEWIRVFGSDCTELHRWGHLAEDPSKYEYYGRSSAWRSAINAVPPGLDNEEFEDWLWKREKLDRLQLIANFRERTTFTSIRGLPLPDNDDYYDSNEIGNRRARFHWCFFGKITHFTKFGDSAMALEDIDGAEVKLVFNTEEKGRELPAELVRIGYTIAIINASSHNFIDDEGNNVQIGILHDDELLLKIFPISIQNLFALNNRVQKFSKELDGIRTCHGCGLQGGWMEGKGAQG
ncbi:hypothetical protein SBOR_4735 [Sclerotinia borealis F-4128]|uniref:SET domain-containing protein n=1 Tax=Sclerotinia borealis (strain F-4128) TaxID=1432307 RepID=W9CJN6_SCLBF|nr:hypothetical protein SBOR_4735 [Sclerotinia borealis F-4128]